MRRMTEYIFRGADLFQVERGEKLSYTRGVISPAGQEEVLALPQGTVREPLYLYLGDWEELQPGDLLRGQGGCYRVLSARLVSAFGRILGMRALLEEAGEEPQS